MENRGRLWNEQRAGREETGPGTNFFWYGNGMETVWFFYVRQIDERERGPSGGESSAAASASRNLPARPTGGTEQLEVLRFVKSPKVPDL